MSEKIKEYIEREAAIELGKKQSCAGIIDGGDFCNISANMLRNIPAADVVEVKHGEWKHGREICRTMLVNKTVAVEYEDFHCSVCGITVEVWEMPRFKYCPNCGAKMDGGKNEANINKKLDFTKHTGNALNYPN